MKKIYLLQTGGTIGSSITDGRIDVDRTKGDALVKAYLDYTTQAIAFERHNPFNILSENIVPKHWLQMIHALNCIDFSQYDGIILCHGSDTLPYTAAALSYAFADIPIPLVLVCADHPLGHPQSNALPNMDAAVDFICTASCGGVFAAYTNSDGKMSIHLGSRLLEADWIYDDFQSFGGKPFAHIEGHRFCSDTQCAPPFDAVAEHGEKATPHPPVADFKHTVLALRACPGFDYRMIDTTTHKPAAILHALYHTGAGNSDGTDGTALADFIKATPTTAHYLISYKDLSDAQYATSLDLIAAGGVPLQNISFEAAYTKLWFAYNQTQVTPEAYMKAERFFEFIH